MSFEKFISFFDYNSYVTLSMFFISLFVYFLDLLTRGKASLYFFSSERASLLNPLTYVRFFTHILGHSDWDHLSSNYLKILLLGPLIEEKYGSINYLVMILITAFVVALVNFIQGKYRIKGASSISFMLTLLSAFVNVSSHKIPITLILIILFYLIDEVRDLWKRDNISHSSHLVGALCGIIFGFICERNSIVNIIKSIF